MQKVLYPRECQIVVCIVEKSKIESLEQEGKTEGRPWRLFLDCPGFVREETEAKGG